MYKDGQEQKVGGMSSNKAPVHAAPKIESEEFFHDYTDGDFVHPDGRKMIEVGPENTILVRMSDIHELPQIRETITEQDIEDLSHKIIRDNEALANAETAEEISMALDLMHPPGLLYLQPAELGLFLAQHADFYELEEPIVIPHNNKPVILRNEGHRRGRAVEHIVVKMKGMTLDDVAMRSSLHFGMTFKEANRRQAKENSHVQTSAIEDANNIIRQFKFISRNEGREPSVKEIADIYGCSESKVRTALSFDSLPDGVKALVGTEKGEEQLPLGVLADLAPLRDMYGRRYLERSRTNPGVYPMGGYDEYVAEEIESFAMKRANDKKEGKSLAAIYNVISGEKKSVSEGLTIPEDEFLLFQIERVKPKNQLEEQYRRLGKNCLYGLELAASNGGLAVDQITRIEQLLEIAKSHAQPAHPNNQESMF